MTCNYVYRYPNELQLEILKQNEPFFADSKQGIKYSPYYSEHRISNLVIERLQLKGFDVSKEELNKNKQKNALASLLCHKYGIGIRNHLSLSVMQYQRRLTVSMVHIAIRMRLDRLIRVGMKILCLFIRNIGKALVYFEYIKCWLTGSGYGATVLFANCQRVTYVDIAHTGLEKIKELNPLSRVIVSSADDLSFIRDNSHDLYVSLRTYNSSFFNIKEAISEAHRVLRPNAVIVISVANGFLCPERHCVIPGLIISGTELVDIYRGMDTIKLIYSEFIQAGFDNIQLWPTNTEIYISAVAT